MTTAFIKFENENVDQNVIYIQRKLAEARKIKTKLRTLGAGFGLNLYENKLCESAEKITYINLKNNEFKPYMTPSNTLICHPNNSLAKCYEAASEQNRMIYGTPFYYQISIGGAICVGAIGGHVIGHNTASYVKRLWIVDSRGEPREISNENELKYFRSTFGYLGIIYRIELETFPQINFRIRKIKSEIPFNYNNHVCQLVLNNITYDTDNSNNNSFTKIMRKILNIDVENIDKQKYEYINIIFEKTDDEPASYLDLKLQNFRKNFLFLADGANSAIYKSVLAGFYDLFLPLNDTTTNSVGLVNAFPILPKIVLGYIPISLECCVYIEEKNLFLALDIIKKYYKSWYQENNLDCINLVIRRIIANDNCMLDSTKGFNHTILVGIDFGFYNGNAHQILLDQAIQELLPVAYSFHLGKYINLNIINHMKERFREYLHEFHILKIKYDPDAIFSTNMLDYLFEI